ncbi:MAG: 2-C-methyl-D-erythritol 2,4-cyclodiphosphate synthase [Bdellovibrionota bacterium]|nr:MAG: 2-C-methyl-D-erythritol 2,4-cyclodiphosphate synthase [Bdellovibrionota bacterium]
MSLPFRDLRIGQGLDIHPLAKGRRCVLGGVEFPEASHGPAGHSDGDVLLHAVMDALLGACGKADIGHLFPSSGADSARWKNADSRGMLAQVVTMLHSDDWSVWNVDCTLLAEIPRIAPRIDHMKESLSALLKVPVERVGIKATTAERLGCIGREEGILATCVALIVKT